MASILLGDCVEILNSLPAESVDLVFADPPFNIGLKYDEYKDSLTPKQYQDWTDKWLDGCQRVLKRSGSIYTAIGDDYAAELGVALKKRFTMRNWLIWHYGFGQSTKKKFNRCHTHIFYHVKNAKDFVWNADAIKVPSDRQVKYGDKRAKAGGKMPDDVWSTGADEALSDAADMLDQMPGGAQGARPSISDVSEWPDWKKRVLNTVLHGTQWDKPQKGATQWFEDAVAMVDAAAPNDGSDEVVPDDVWSIPRLCGTFNERIRKEDGSVHPCQMPESILERIILASCPAKGVVLDPFGGTGTTAAVAQRLGRDWVTMDRSEAYCEVIAKRLGTKWEKFVAPNDDVQMPLFL
jgi:DNA modification methylase